jgi:uncharacterized protein YndB with AHSA1/START domain
MSRASATTAIDAPRERAFEFLADLANRAAIMDRFADNFRLQRVESAGVGAAARFRVRRPRIWMETVIEEADPPFRIRERGRAGRVGRIPTETVWELTDGPVPGTCEVRVTSWAEPAHPLDRLRGLLGARSNRRNWRSALARLKEVVEDSGPVERVEVAGADRLPALT